MVLCVEVWWLLPLMLVNSTILYSTADSLRSHSSVKFHSMYIPGTLKYLLNTDFPPFFTAGAVPHSVLLRIWGFEFGQFFASTPFLQLGYQFCETLWALWQVPSFHPFHCRHGQMRKPMPIFAQPRDFSNSFQIPFSTYPIWKCFRNPRFTYLA